MSEQQFAQRMEILTPHFFAGLAARIAEMQAAGQDVIRLDEGSPDLPPPPHILEALYQAAVCSDSHGYVPHRGIPALRQAWTELYGRVHGVQLDPEREVLPLLGSKEGIFHLLLAYVGPGDVVLAPDPGYVTYGRGARFAGAEVHPLPLRAEWGYQPDWGAIPPEVLARARMVWLNYPHNPTGAVASPELLREAVEFAQRHNLLLCHDAAYSQVTFNGRPAPSVLEAPGAKDVAVEFNTLSKSHNMAGWRVGAAVGIPEVLQALFRLKTNADSGHFRPILEAAVAAMTGDQGWLVERNEVYRRRRDCVVSGLRAIGLDPAVPQASLYVWSPVPEGRTSASFATAALEQAQVSVTPGTVFGPGGEGFVRVAITAPIERIEQAMDRLKMARQQLWQPGEGE